MESLKNGFGVTGVIKRAISRYERTLTFSLEKSWSDL